MSFKIDPAEFNLMRDYIEKHCGISLDEQKTYLVETRLTTLMVENGCKNFKEFYSKALSDKTNTLRDKIVDAMTTNETLWFRDVYPYTILKEVLLPQFGKEFTSGTRRKIRIWSAASSSGQEPYSIAMIIKEYCRLHNQFTPKDIEIIGTDISPTVLFLAKAGRYDSMVISRGLQDDLRAKYFTQDGKVWVLSNEIKEMVQFRKLNLQESYASLGKFDIVFCRNVLIYFSDSFKKDVLERIAKTLQPPGYLFVGASESVSNYSNAYKMLNHNKSLYYSAI